MIALSPAKLYSFILSIAIIAIYGGFIQTNAQATCPSGWISRVDQDGATYGYKVIMNDWLNYYEAQGYCVRAGGQVASIHSAAENAFIASISNAQLKQCQTNDSVCATRIAHTSAGWAFLDSLMRSFWFGMNRIQYEPSYNNTIDCSYPDGTPCDFGRFDGIANSNTNSPPWSPACPSGSNSSNGVGDLEYCTMFFNASTTLVWNDMSCYQKLGGVVCKMNCSAIKTTQTCPTSAVITTKAAAATTKAAVTSGSGSSGSGGSSGGSGNNNGTCSCKGGSCTGTGYQCGSDDWQWKINKKSGKAFAYKAFNYTGCYWKGLAICKKYKAVPCSIQSNDENDFIVNTVCSGFLSSNSTGSSRKRRAASSTCIYTGIHRLVTNPSTGSVSCSCSDGSSCDYGNDDAQGDTTTTSFTSTTSRATTLKSSTTQKSATTTQKAATTTTQKLTTSTIISTSTAQPSNPWAPGCPANSTTGLGDSGGYGTKNCIGINGDGKWVDQSCDRPATAIVCMKECDAPQA
ncbi:hypothetical protein ACQ4LE_000542 [Meloidogyne hapla]|uniref:C-type lectin domain-containing protein n=1 Tax=Meloidogyne hapla TaxID=6305 RepID=A0A1I8BLK6_MELHA